MDLYRAFSGIFNDEKYHDLEIPVRGQSRSLKAGICIRYLRALG